MLCTCGNAKILPTALAFFAENSGYLEKLGYDLPVLHLETVDFTQLQVPCVPRAPEAAKHGDSVFGTPCSVARASVLMCTQAGLCTFRRFTCHTSPTQPRKTSGRGLGKGLN